MHPHLGTQSKSSVRGEGGVRGGEGDDEGGDEGDQGGDGGDGGGDTCQALRYARHCSINSPLKD